MEPKVSAPQSGMRVLVLSGNPEDFLRINEMASHFTALAVHMMRAANYDEGLISLREVLFDAVLVDDPGEGHTGLEFIEAARAQGCRGPMILLTSLDDAQADFDARRTGASDYLMKQALHPELVERTLRYALERQRTLEALRRSDEYYRVIIDNSLDLISIIDENATLSFESPSVKKILGFDPAERLGTEFYLYLHPADLQATRRFMEQAMKSKEGEAFGEYRMRHKNGSWRHLEFKAKNLLQFSGLNGVLLNSRDVTERKRNMESLLKVERLAFLGQLTAGMAHEIRNPLAIIQMSAEMLRDNDDGDEEGKRHASVILQQCERLLQLMNETLDYSKNKAVELSAADPKEIFAHALKLAQIQFGSAHEKCVVRWIDSPTLPGLQLDKQKTELVLVNLILNAFQAVVSGGELKLGWMSSGDGILFMVEDNGLGMNDEDLDRIFDPFFTTKQHGSGLGLWLCQRMVDASGGRLGVESSRNKGSRFTVWLPLQGEKNENPGD